MASRVPFSLVAMICAIVVVDSSTAQEKKNSTLLEPVRIFGSSAFRAASALQFAVMLPDGETMITTSDAGVISSWNLETGELKPFASGDRTRGSLHLSPDGKRVAAIVGYEVRIWDTAGAVQPRKFTNLTPPYLAFFRPDSENLIVTLEDQIANWGPDGRFTKIDTYHRFVSPAFSTDGRHFAFAEPSKGTPETIVVYDAQTLKPRCKLKTGKFGISRAPVSQKVCLAFSGDGKLAATPAKDGLTIWDADTGKEVRSLTPKIAAAASAEERRYEFLVFSPDGQELFAATEAGTIQRWRVSDGNELTALKSDQPRIMSLVWAKKGKWLVAACGDGMIRRWDTATGQEIEPPAGFTGTLYSRISPSGKRAAFLDSKGRFEIWDIETGKRIVSLLKAGEARLQISSLDQSFGFLAGDDRAYLDNRLEHRVSIWDLTTGKKLASIDTGTKGIKAGFHFCVPTPDGKSFVVNHGFTRFAKISATDGSLEWISPEIFARGMIFAPQFSPDGKHLAAGCIDNKAKPKSMLSGTLEFVRLDPATGEVTGRIELDTGSSGSTMWFSQPQFSADGKLVKLHYGSFEVFTVDAANWKQTSKGGALSNCFSPDGKFAVETGSNSLSIVSLEQKKRIASFSAPVSFAPSANFLPDGVRVLTSSSAGIGQLWDLSPWLKPDRK